MRHHRITLGAALLAMAMVASPLAAQDLPGRRALDLDATFRFGTLGLGVEAGKLLTNRIAARVGANFGGTASRRSSRTSCTAPI